jgi:hypothetical protein
MFCLSKYISVYVSDEEEEKKTGSNVPMTKKIISLTITSLPQE